MIVWLVALAMAAVLTLLLLRGRRRQVRAGLAVGLALTAGLVGYAATGAPERPSMQAPPKTFDRDWRSAFETARQTRLQRFGEIGAWLTFSDAMIREDASDLAVRGLQGVLVENPQSPDLWIGLGNALAMHGGGVGDAATLAFARARVLRPGDDTADFFLGLAKLETGDPRSAAAVWRTLPPQANLDDWIAEADRRS